MLSRAHRAFSLIELLVVVAILAILIALALPALGKARITARQTLALSNVRQVGTTFTMYTDAFRVYPYVALGKAAAPDVNMPVNPNIFIVPWYPKGAFIGTTNVFDVAHLWPGVISSIAPWEDNYRLWISPGRSPEIPKLEDGVHTDIDRFVSLQYSNSFIGSADLWSSRAVGQDGTRLVRASAPADVLFPSAKALLWDSDLAYLPKEPPRRENHYDAPAAIVFADTHADLRNPLDAAPGFANALNDADTTRLHNTPDGVRGRDF